ncbi:MAG: hypothetical protein IKF90_04245 [Parasporobacterium sp.]|nr:hypothetical protein [Parasporobacterium sp.]
MTEKEIAVLFDFFKSVYRDSWMKGMNEADVLRTMKTWRILFGEIDTAMIFQAAKEYARAGKFPPVPADLITTAAKIYRHDPEPGEAWANVLEAAGRLTRDGIEAFNDLPPIVRKALGSFRQLRTIALTDENRLSLLQSQFIAEYKAVQQKPEYFDLPKLDAETRLQIEVMDDEKKPIPARGGLSGYQKFAEEYRQKNCRNRRNSLFNKAAADRLLQEFIEHPEIVKNDEPQC